MPVVMNLENLSRYLVEFQRQRYEDLEITGQYLQPRDAVDNKDFVRIDRFHPVVHTVRKVRWELQRAQAAAALICAVELTMWSPTRRFTRAHARTLGGWQHGTSYRRLTMRGTNGRMYPFLVQHSSSRHARAEERIVQLVRMLNEYVLLLFGHGRTWEEGGRGRRGTKSRGGGVTNGQWVPTPPSVVHSDTLTIR